MPVPVPIEYRMRSRTKGGLNALYFALLLLTLHWAIVLYVNSSYLEQFVGARALGSLFVLGALMSIAIFFNAPAILNRIGNLQALVIGTAIELVALLGMAYTTVPEAAMVLFVLHHAVVPVLLFNLDIFMEELIGENEGVTGTRRGLLLTVMSITSALGALLMGKLLGTGLPDFAFAYTASAFLLIPFLYIVISRFKTFTDPVYPSFRVREAISGFWKHVDIRNVFAAHFLLQFFFTWMVIYTPVYLASLGFNWEEIGIMLFAGLMAYVFLEYLIGYVADTYIGEKEMMAFGFAIIGIATSWFIFLDESSIIAWMFAMFMTRVGASFVEVTTESYFFKHTQGKDAGVIGLFRITRPLSYVLGAVLGGLTLRYLPFELLFVVLGLLMIPGLFFAMALHDTK